MKSGKKMYWNTSNPPTGHLLFFFFSCLSHGTIDSLTSFPPIYHLLTSSATTGGTLPLTSFAQSPISLITHHHPSPEVQTPSPPFSSSPANTQLQLRPFWPTSTQYPLPVAPPPSPLFFFTLSLTGNRPLFADAVKFARRKHSWGKSVFPCVWMPER